MRPAKPQARRRQKSSKPADLYAAYLASRPESDPRLLLPRSALPLARGAVLLRGVLVEQWSVAWLAAFLFAEFFLVVRLAVLGDRWSGGPKLDPEIHRRASVLEQLAWLAISLAAIAFAGQGLDRSTRGAWFGFGASGALWVWPGWGIVAYLLLLLGEFVFDLLAARRERRTFASAGVLQATFFLVAVLLLAFAGVFLAAFLGDWFGDEGARAIVALLLVLARTGSDLAVLWLPVWGPGRVAKRSAVPGAGEH
jgi:hypothetical protein